MKVLLVADLYAPLIGGTERHVQNLARELVFRGHSVAVATMQPSGSPVTEVDGFGVRIYRIDQGWAQRVTGAYSSARPHHPSVADPGVSAALRLITTKERPDVVYAHNWMLYSYLSAADRQARVPVLACLHDYWPICPARSLVSGGRTCRHDTLSATIRCAVRAYGQAKGLALALGLWDARRRWHHRVDRYLAVSQFVADACQPALAGRPVHVAPTFVSSDLVSVIENTPAPDFLPDRPYLLYVGRLSAAKGVTILADAYRQLGPSAPPLLVLGAQDADCSVHWPTNVHVFHNVPHNQVMAAWRRAEVGIIPSTYPEPFGQVAIEAMATGIPVVASDVGGLAEVVGKYPGGTLVPAGSPTALAEGIGLALNDPRQRVRAQAAGPAIAAEFFVSNVADIVERHLNEVIDSHHVGETSVQL
jgi:glycosyltransferase involved in cell wall biosynthesis